jgi:4-hydroxy-tetrahydrodipicolinate synthase
MITPFTPTGAVDYEGLKYLTDWYLSHGVDGLFAVCQSSEMFHLSLEEKGEILRTVVTRVAGRCPVIASGHTSDRLDDQVEEVGAMYEAGADAVVLVTNRFGSQEGDEREWRADVETLLQRIPAAIPLGLYECPHPFKRLLTNELLAWILTTNRFFFLKDTSCDRGIQRERAALCKGSSLRLYNANSTSLLSSLRSGYAGFSGVMANFHPELYVWICRKWSDFPVVAEQLQALLGIASLIEGHGYPKNAKDFLAARGVPITDVCRSIRKPLLDHWEEELRQLHDLVELAPMQVHADLGSLSG